MSDEIWKDITIEDNKYVGLYQVSNLGRVRSLDRLTPYKGCHTRKHKSVLLQPASSGTRSVYLKVTLALLGERLNKTVHSLVAKAFIPNPENKRTVNHIDENKLNNNLENLEWATNQEQMDHSLSYKVYQYTKEGRYIDEFKSGREASRQLNIQQSRIVRCCNKVVRFNTAGGFKWRWAKEVKDIHSTI